MITMWTDGSASPNPGPGGFAVLDGETGRPLVLGSSKGEKTTNIKMEGEALIAAMEYAAGEPCEIYSDSEFWIKTLTEWAPGWRANGWRKRGGPIKNLELVQKAYKLYEQGDVDLIYVRGHVGTALNEQADEWANKARKGAKI